jgi:peptidoglycan/LPS O-acetylase OafA/YrhL
MLVVIATILLAHHYQNYLAYGGGAQDSTTIDAKFAALFAANIHFANIGTNYFDQGLPPSPLLHFWSLAVEEQFYVVWPTIVLVLGLMLRRWIRPTVLVAAAAATVASYIWAVHEVNVNATWAFFSPFTRAWELGIGAVAATVVIYAGRLHKWVGFALGWAGLVAIGLSAHYGGNNFPGRNALLPVLGAVAVVIGGASGIGAGHLLAFHPVRAVGRVSYGWYLLHYPPMILLAGILWGGPLPVHERLLISLATLAIAFAMYFVIEKPIRRSRYLAARPWTSIAMGLALVSSAFVIAALYHKGPFG